MRGHFRGANVELPIYQADQNHKKLTKDEEAFFHRFSLFAVFSFEIKQIFKEQGGVVFENDQLMRGFSLIMEDKKIYTWVVLTIQLFVDIRRILGKDLDRCLNEFHKMEKWLSKTIKLTRNFGQSFFINHWHKVNDPALAQMEKHTGLLVRQDYIQAFFWMTNY